MKKIIAILGLLMLFLIQFGSVGFTVYKNECNKEKISTYTLENVDCCCSKSESKSESKSCCKSKSEKSCAKPTEKSCCSKKQDTESFTKKCCTTDLLNLKLACESYNFNSYDLNLDNTNEFQIAVLHNFKISNTNLNSNLITENYNCNSPPLYNYNKRILFQSFQI